MDLVTLLEQSQNNQFQFRTISEGKKIDQNSSQIQKTNSNPQKNLMIKNKIGKPKIRRKTRRIKKKITEKSEDSCGIK